MNDFMKGQIRNIITIIEHSEKTIELSAMQDDGKISLQEKKEMNKLKEINENYIKKLKKLIGK